MLLHRPPSSRRIVIWAIMNASSRPVTSAATSARVRVESIQPARVMLSRRCAARRSDVSVRHSSVSTLRLPPWHIAPPYRISFQEVSLPKGNESSRRARQTSQNDRPCQSEGSLPAGLGLRGPWSRPPSDGGAATMATFESVETRRRPSAWETVVVVVAGPRNVEDRLVSLSSKARLVSSSGGSLSPPPQPWPPQVDRRAAPALAETTRAWQSRVAAASRRESRAGARHVHADRGRSWTTT